MSDSESESKLEYSLAGGLALTVRPEDFEGLCAQLVKEGYGSACLFPFRALIKKGGVEALKESGLSIVHLEQAWNPTSKDSLPLAVLAGLLGHWKKLRGDGGQPPILQDALFPGKATGERLFRELMDVFPKAKVISYDVEAAWKDERLLLGVDPGKTQDLQRFIEETEARGVSVFFDPHNVIAGTISLPGKPTKKKRDWEPQFQALAKTGRLEVVDIHPVGENDVRDLKEGRGMLRELAQAACEIGTVEFLRIEIPFPLRLQIPGTSPLGRGDFLWEIAQALKD